MTFLPLPPARIEQPQGARAKRPGTSAARAGLATRPGPHGWLLLALCAMSQLCGCVTPWERDALLSDKGAKIDNVQGPTERGLRGLLRDQPQKTSQADSPLLQPLAGTDEYNAALALIEQGQREEGQKALKKVAKKFKKSEIREDALFSLAESYYADERYAKAYDAYGEVLNEFPATRHLPNISNRLFRIAQVWLNDPEVANLSEIRQVDYDEPSKRLPAETPAPRDPSILAMNLTNKREPLFDTPGNALSALKLIWMNDPTGPLADDALMLAASHYARQGDFVEADHHFTLLREQFPTSPHVQSAFVLGSHVKLMSYEGADYDGKSLNDATQLKETIRRLYPNSEDAARVDAELKKIAEERANRDWQMVDLYERKGNYRAAAIYCHIVLSRHPETSFAELARQKLIDYGPQYASGSALLKSSPDAKKTLWDAIRGRDPSQVTPDNHWELTSAGRFGRRPPSDRTAQPQQTAEAPTAGAAGQPGGTGAGTPGATGTPGTTPQDTPDAAESDRRSRFGLPRWSSPKDQFDPIERDSRQDQFDESGDRPYDEDDATPEGAARKRGWNPFRREPPAKLPEGAGEEAAPVDTAPISVSEEDADSSARPAGRASLDDQPSGETWE